MTEAGLQRTHAINRTSLKGGPFLGTCSLCGKTGLRISDANKACDNVRAISCEAALIEMIEPSEVRSSSTGRV
ncbi:MAG: hypothetical protein ACREDP_22575 [Bradyrhizobium sp.]